MRENPFRNILLLIAVVGAIVGAILIANGPVLLPQGEIFDPFVTMGQFIWGAVILGAAIVAFLVWLGVSAIGWAIEHPPEPAEEKRGT